MTNSEKVLIEKLDQIIDSNFENSTFSTDDICRELGLSRSQLFRLVKEHSQLSISLYIRQRKLTKAKDLLDNSDLKIAEITYKIGIDSPQSFSKYFVETYGVSPTEYRKNKIAYVQEKAVQIVGNEPVIKEISKRNSKKYLYFGVAIIALLIFVSSIYFWQKGKNSENISYEKNGQETENSIAILPFKNLGSAENSYFSDGLMGQVHSSLAMLEDLKVISKNSSLLFKDSKKTIPQIANELHISYILDGTVTQTGKNILVSIELVKANEDRAIWTKNFDGETKDVLAFMNKVSTEIVSELHKKLSNFEAKKFDRIPTQNIEAYNEYLQGLELMKSRNKEKLEASIKLFDKAIGLDSQFADAYAAKASVYFIMVGFNYISQALSVKMAEKNALDAIRIDANNATAYAALAGAYESQYKWEQAITTFQIALKHSPNDAQINYWYSLALRSIGAFDAAIMYSKKAAELDPLTVISYTGYINSCSFAGKFELAKEAIDKKALIFDNHFMYFYSRGTYYVCKGEYQEALKEFQKVDSMSKYPTSAYAIAFCHAKLGQKAPVEKYIASQPQTPDGYSNMAYAYAGLGDKEQCFKYLQLAAQDNVLPNYIKVDPYFKFLHGDKRFDELLQKFGLLDVKVEVE